MTIMLSIFKSHNLFVIIVTLMQQYDIYSIVQRLKSVTLN